MKGTVTGVGVEGREIICLCVHSPNAVRPGWATPGPWDSIQGSMCVTGVQVFEPSFNSFQRHIIRELHWKLSNWDSKLCCDMAYSMASGSLAHCEPCWPLGSLLLAIVLETISLLRAI